MRFGCGFRAFWIPAPGHSISSANFGDSVAINFVIRPSSLLSSLGGSTGSKTLCMPGEGEIWVRVPDSTITFFLFFFKHLGWLMTHISKGIKLTKHVTITYFLWRLLLPQGRRILRAWKFSIDIYIYISSTVADTHNHPWRLSAMWTFSAPADQPQQKWEYLPSHSILWIITCLLWWARLRTRARTFQ